ncbi:fluoride efflux transporter FluC [Vreelandella massiliensis]|uniref:fluoride efflux transporter FluC n=1 Tax=Vreelandella massiliensis TaxID=1816686 RepID=UPI00096AAB95|nr:CrcB family protein [Halomonas massiliensis]MYL23591.1 chromosome condensation protein CrcB [Halomonas alkaliantarctica]
MSLHHRDHQALKRYLATGLGSALGAGLRYGLSVGAVQTLGPIFPWVTLVINVIGSGLIAWLASHAHQYPHGHVSRWHHFWLAGFCGGFTTFSLFSLEVLLLWQWNQIPLALLYGLLSVSGWLIAAHIGQRLNGSKT